MKKPRASDTHFTKNSLYFGKIRIYRAYTVPQMDEGRNGDLVIIDPEPSNPDPLSVGLWIKLPLNDVRSPSGTVVTGTPGTVNDSNTIVINNVIVTLSNPNDQISIVNDINHAIIPNLLSINIGNAIQLIETNEGAITVSENTLGLYSFPALVDLNITGVWAPIRVSGSNTFTTKAISVLIENPLEKAYILLSRSVQYFTITAVTVQTSFGAIDISFQNNGVAIPGLGSITATTVQTTTPTTSDSDVIVGDKLSIVATNKSGATDLSITVAYEVREG